MRVFAMRDLLGQIALLSARGTRTEHAAAATVGSDQSWVARLATVCAIRGGRG